MSQAQLLITGAPGLVGKALQRLISSNDNDGYVAYISSSDADLTDAAQARQVFDTYRPKNVIHLAARVGGLYSNMRSQLDFYRANSLINDNVLHCAFNCPETEKIVSCLSTCIFPDQIEYPIDETQLHLGPPHDSNFGYSYAKRMVDVMNRAYNIECQTKGYNKLFTSVIPTNVYGPNDNFNIDSGHVIPSIIHKTHLSVTEALSVTNNQGTHIKTIVKVLGSGAPRRQFIYSDDLARLILWTVDNYCDQDPIILSVDETDEISICQVAQAIAHAFEVHHKHKIKIELQFDKSFSDGQLRKTASNRKLRSYLQDFQFTSLAEGIQTTVDWFCENYQQARK